MAAPVIQVRRGLFSNLPGLKAGEPGFTTDKYDLFVGLDETTNNNQFFGSGRYWEREDGSNAAQLNLVDKDGTNSISLQAPDTTTGIGTWILPNNGSGSSGEVLRINTLSGNEYTLEWAPSPGANAIEGISIQDEGSAAGPEGAAGIGSVTTINFVGGGVVAEFSDAPSGVSTVTVAQASTTQEGTASFTAADFGVASGVVSLGDDVVKDITTDSGALTPAGHTFSILGGEGVDVTHSGTTITVAGEAASSTNAGIASFSSDDFTVTGFQVALNDNLSFTDLSVTNLDVSGITTTVGLNVTGNTTLGDASGDTLTVNATATFNETITGTATTAQTVNTTLTTANAEYYPVFVANNASTTGETIRVDSDGLSYNPSGNVLTVPTLDTETIRHTNDTTALTIDTSGNVTAPQNLTVSGDLTVNGTTTQVNTTEVQVYDRTITLGIQTGSTPTTTTWDLGVMMQYGDAGVAKTAGVIWEYGNERFQFASNSDNPSSGNNTTTPNITVATFAPIEIGELWINDTQGQEQVIYHNGTDRVLENILVDAGSF